MSGSDDSAAGRSRLPSGQREAPGTPDITAYIVARIAKLKVPVGFCGICAAKQKNSAYAPYNSREDGSEGVFAHCREDVGEILAILSE